jgi:branched-chain amino acid aminotransferase
MPAYIRILTPDGLQPVDYSADSLNDAAVFEPQNGIYTVANTYKIFYVLKFDAHLDRMEDSARRENIPLKLNRTALKSALHSMITDAGFGDVRFRVTVPAAQPDHFIITLEPYKPPSPQIIAQGVRCSTIPNSARSHAASKTTGWMHTRASLRNDDAYETLLLDAQNHILEGSGSNFYAILDGELRTAGEGVLPGIAQQVIFEIAPGIVPVNKIPVRLDDLPRVEEAFITSSSRGIIPVVKIDGKVIGEGVPGALTMVLREAYTRWVKAHLVEL